MISDILQSFGLTHVGMRRGHNEDTLFFSDDLGLYLVADGMGGHAYGEVASALAVETLVGQLKDSRQAQTTFSLGEAIKRSNQCVYQRSKAMNESQTQTATLIAGMGTTLVALYIDHDLAWIAHVGDSRVYRMRDTRLEALTRDHSLVAMAADSSDFSLSMRTRLKNVITRAIGTEPDVEADIRQESLCSGDLFLLCSDGLTNMVSDQRMEEILVSDPSLQSACGTLIEEANRNGGRDNISCVLVRVEPYPSRHSE